MVENKSNSRRILQLFFKLIRIDLEIQASLATLLKEHS